MKLNIKLEGTTMDKEEAERIINQILKEVDAFREEPTYIRALQLDKDITILRYIIGEANFLPLHYFRAAHEEAVKYIDNMNKQNNGDNK